MWVVALNFEELPGDFVEINTRSSNYLWYR